MNTVTGVNLKWRNL